MGEVIEREGSTHSKLSSSLSVCSSNLSSLLSTPSSISSISSSVSTIALNDLSRCSFNIAFEPVEKASASAYNNQEYDDNSNSLDALRSSESGGQVGTLGSIYDSPDNFLDFSASVEMTKQAKKMTSLISTILYDIGSDNVTWLWLALYVLTYR